MIDSANAVDVVCWESGSTRVLTEGDGAETVRVGSRAHATNTMSATSRNRVTNRLSRMPSAIAGFVSSSVAGVVSKLAGCGVGFLARVGNRLAGLNLKARFPIHTISY